MNPIRRGLAANAIALCLAWSAGLPAVAGVDFAGHRATSDVRRVATWVMASADSRGLPFVVIDKVDARVYVFGADGRLRGAAPILLGLARGDHTVPGIGDRALKDIRTDERTTPAGRFLAEPGRNHTGEDIVWVDYDAAVSMHRVRAVSASERRLERLASRTPKDNRISYGCINLPARFYDDVLVRTMAGKRAVVYVLPEVRSLQEVFDFAPPRGAGLQAAAAR